MTPVHMPRLSEERLREILAATEGVTGGRWVASPDPEADEGLVSHIVRPVKIAANGVEYIDVLPRFEFPIIGNMQGEKQNGTDAAHIANCDPATIAALVTEVLAAREALQVAYTGLLDAADKFNVIHHNHPGGAADSPLSHRQAEDKEFCAEMSDRMSDLCRRIAPALKETTDA